MLQNYYRQHGHIPKFSQEAVDLGDTKMRGKDAYAQVVISFKMWEGQLKNVGRSIIHSLQLEESLEKEMYTLNKYGLWLQPEKVSGIPISPLAQSLAKDLFRELLSLRPMPIVGAKPIVTFSQANSVYRRDARKSKEFPEWLSIMSLKPRKPIHVPIKPDSYFANAGGKVNGTITLSIIEDEVVLIMTRTLPDLIKDERFGTLGLDWGFKTLFSTSDGRLFGRKLHDWLLKRDIEIIELEKRLKKLGIPLRESSRYRKLQHRVRSYVTNEVKRVLNLIADEGWAELAVESLDFRGKGFSKTLNRILQRAGRNAVRTKLEELATRGVIVTEVNPAYTSQECSSCGFTHSSNRKRERFVCLACGYSCHADVQGAKVILSRRSRKNTWLFTSRKTVLQRLEEEYMRNHGHSFSHVLERKSRPRYWASGNEKDKTNTAGLVFAPFATSQL